MYNAQFDMRRAPATCTISLRVIDSRFGHGRSLAKVMPKKSPGNS